MNKIIELIKAGGMPALTGIHLTQKEIDAIHSVIEEKKKELDDYFKTCIETRLIN